MHLGEPSPGFVLFSKNTISNLGEHVGEQSKKSLETCEAVDLQRLPGLQTLWQQHDLNVQGDASHFVNTLWLATQSRAFAYRYAEIQPGGLLKDHIQMLIHIDFPAHCLDEVHFQDLINEWCNEGLGQYFMDEKRGPRLSPPEVDGTVTITPF